MGIPARSRNTARGGIQIKRAYDSPAPGDGFRVLVERLWPRGLTREKAAVDLWMKEIAPSTELRKWYAHDVAKWKEFRTRYRTELNRNSELLEQLAEKAREGPLTLVYAAKDEEHNSALLVKETLEERV